MTNQEVLDSHGNLLFTVEVQADECSSVAMLEMQVSGVTGMPREITLYSGRAVKELKALLETMLADTGH